MRIRGSREGGRGGCSWQRQRREGEGRREEGAQPIAHPGSGDGLRAPQASFSPCLTLHHSDTVWGREDVHSSNGHRPEAPGLHISREWSPSPGTMETPSESSFMMTVEGYQPIGTAAVQQGPHTTYRNSSCTTGATLPCSRTSRPSAKLSSNNFRTHLWLTSPHHLLHSHTSPGPCHPCLRAVSACYIHSCLSMLHPHAVARQPFINLSKGISIAAQSPPGAPSI